MSGFVTLSYRPGPTLLADRGVNDETARASGYSYEASFV